MLVVNGDSEVRNALRRQPALLEALEAIVEAPGAVPADGTRMVASDALMSLRLSESEYEKFAGQAPSPGRDSSPEVASISPLTSSPSESKSIHTLSASLGQSPPDENAPKPRSPKPPLPPKPRSPTSTVSGVQQLRQELLSPPASKQAQAPEEPMTPPRAAAPPEMACRRTDPEVFEMEVLDDLERIRGGVLTNMAEEAMERASVAREITAGIARARRLEHELAHEVAIPAASPVAPFPLVHTPSALTATAEVKAMACLLYTSPSPRDS
eukprot:TRINITY_DN37953_c0_g1_i2.p1 TRINITY_DN37953_c0_g1~~TRINITY_DN37953_c0_g1_i2.p1  ORF type:complete len:269 (+),score=60.58 TRINITY_DN37953_c0_g1_i2:240-1046(+)